MQKVDFKVPKDLEPFVNCIILDESQDENGHENLPFYADGYPGIMFQQSENGFYLLPRGKKLSELFLYGQTLKPISLDVKGPYKMMVFQLYPFASKYLLGVDPKELNDDCFDLLQLKNVNVGSYQKQLMETNKPEVQIGIISELMLDLVRAHQLPPNDSIQLAIHRILEARGLITIKQVADEVFVSERTFERHFLAQTGLTAKQFAKIIQFQYSLSKLTKERFDSLTDVGFDSGFSDQSHFTREFKKYTGQTPSYYLDQVA